MSPPLSNQHLTSLINTNPSNMDVYGASHAGHTLMASGLGGGGQHTSSCTSQDQLRGPFGVCMIYKIVQRGLVLDM